MTAPFFVKRQYIKGLQKIFIYPLAVPPLWQYYPLNKCKYRNYSLFCEMGAFWGKGRTPAVAEAMMRNIDRQLLPISRWGAPMRWWGAPQRARMTNMASPTRGEEPVVGRNRAPKVGVLWSSPKGARVAELDRWSPNPGSTQQREARREAAIAREARFEKNFALR